ncbi:mechanosensitive ion channel domain-containing protein [Pseudohalioglobus lutimaris]|uniref:Mechanosensitive ion channel protein MscS n=1 Tax=Pseudohalioglobus lutimaris TaxID=1737061 RepID=A0A2N5X6K9_9GAMM|nr:mechanosensitive ion channel domain-containing protein [Pseudohalioglobus lutimaris]PLW70100.1 hypothetical protein C0039_02495 [Pseudohalioglobus lutimaris]
MIAPVFFPNFPARRVCLLLLTLFIASPLAAQQPPGLDDLASLRRAVDADTNLPEEDSAALVSQLDSAQNLLEARDRFDTRAAQLSELVDDASQQVEQYNQQLAQAKNRKADTGTLLPAAATADQIQGQITLITAERQALSERRTQLLKETDNLATRRAEIQQRLVELRKQQPPPVANTATGTLSERVARALGNAKTLAHTAEQQALELEILSEPARARVNAAERAWLGFAISAADTKLAQLNDALESARSSATEEQLETTAQLQEQLQDRDPVLQQFAAENRALAEQLQSLASTADEARWDSQQLQDTLEGIEQDSLLMHRRLQVAGRKEILGRVMITRLDSLPETDKLKRKIDERNALIADASMTQIDIEEDFRAINDREEYMAALVPDLETWQPEARELANNLVDQRRDLLESNLRRYGSLLHLLLENNESTVQLIDATETFHKFLLGNLLWVRNFTYVDMGTLAKQVAVVLSVDDWAMIPMQLKSGFHAQPWSNTLLALLVLSFILRRRLRPVYDRMLSQPILVSTATLWHMLAGLALSALLVLPWPLLLYLLGFMLREGAPTTEFADALAPALEFTARILYMLLLTRLIASRHGAGRRFLKWNARMLDALRKELNWAGPTVCVAALVDVFVFNLDLVVSGGPLGAAATAVVATSMIVFCIRLLRQPIFNEHALTRFSLRLVIFVAAAVIIMQLMGLLFAADIYLVALGRSIIVLGLIKLVADVLQRWLLILRARLERQSRDESQNSEQATANSDDAEALIDVISLSEAHTKMLTLARFSGAAAALFLIWAPSLPALTLLDSVTLWEVSNSADPTGALRQISLFDLTLSLVILVVTGLVARNLPSISEVFMREWSSMSAGARYASSILLQYLVIAIGGSLFLSTIGWEWGKVQWLVAALGVGIGFGLQEIVANFISGIIILFERPVRVGDIISAGGAEGTVKKINPRATIIETFDRKEHLIPNKELITGQVINWTLSDAAIRVIIPIGIAYGSDARQAMALLLEAATEVDNVLPDPQPRASFEDFGDNALVLWLRCYISEDRIGTWTELRTIINDKFAAAGIAISFPQRDVHLDTVEPLQVEVRHLGAGPEAASGAIPDR